MSNNRKISISKRTEIIDGKSKIKAYALFESLINGSIEVGTTKGLQQIHAYLFGGLYDFMEGNGRTMRIWLDLIFKSSMKLCVDWSKINKAEYLNAMVKSPADSSNLKNLIKNALTDEINSRETYMRGIDYSYYYEESE